MIDEDALTAESGLGPELYREYWGPYHDACITYCRTPPALWRRTSKRIYCVSCHQRAVIRDIESTDVEPQPNRLWYWLGSFLAGWTATWRDCTVGMIRKPAGPVLPVVICRGGVFV